MPRYVRPLTALEVSALKRPGYTAVGGVNGLYLQVLPGENAGRTWILRYTSGLNEQGRQIRREMGLGSLTDVKLAKAREIAAELRKRLENGEDLINERRREASARNAPPVPTFASAADEVYRALSPTWKSEVHKSQWITTMKQDVFPKIGKLPVNEIAISHVMSVLEPIWVAKTTTADRIRERIHGVLEWAESSGFRTGPNPARWKGGLKNLLADPRKLSKKEHFPALPYVEVSDFLNVLEGVAGVAALALRFLILTGLRTTEVTDASWREVDFEEGIMEIPAERMKAGRVHLVPLSAPAVKVLRQLQADHAEHVFVGNRGKPLSNMAMIQLIRRLNKKRNRDGLPLFVDPKFNPPKEITPHGFRSTFCDWASDTTNHSENVIQMSLAHAIGNVVEAAYRRGAMLEKCRRLMDDWADYCVGTAKQ